MLYDFQKKKTSLLLKSPQAAPFYHTVNGRTDDDDDDGLVEWQDKGQHLSVRSKTRCNVTLTTTNLTWAGTGPKPASAEQF